MMKKTVSALLAFLFIFAIGAPAYAADDGTTAQAMRFREDGSFKILQLTDLHKNDDDTYEDVNNCLLRELASTQDADLVVITGDIAMSGTKAEITANIDEIMKPFADYSIPVAVVFGNHDSESGIISREELMAIYNTHPNSVSVDEGALLPGCGTYTIPILSSAGDELAFNLWMIDSGDYDEQGRYGVVTPEQIAWYVNKSEALQAQNNGEIIPSLMFQHIPVPEIYDALLEVNRFTPYAVKRIYTDDRFYVVNPDNINAGRLAEYPCPPYYNNGQFDAVAARGDVLAMFFGHDHSNTFNITHRGVDLVATPKTNFQGYGSDRGARMITLNESDLSTYETHLVRFTSLYDWNDLSPASLISSGIRLGSAEFKTILTMNFFDVLYRLEYFFATTLVEVVTGMKFDY